MEFSIDHLGIAVKSLAAAKSIYEKLGLSVSPEETVEQEKVRSSDGSGWRKPAGIAGSHFGRFDYRQVHRQARRRLHHICMRVPDLAAAVDVKSDGVRLVSNEIKTGAGGHRYVFVHPSEHRRRVAGTGSKVTRRIEHRAPNQIPQMLLLSIDTSGRQGSIALARVEEQTKEKDISSEMEIIEIMPLVGGTFSAQLIPQIYVDFK